MTEVERVLLMSKAQDEVGRVFLLAHGKYRGENATISPLWRDYDLWRQANSPGHYAWAMQQKRDDGTPYPLSLWLAEGRDIAARSAALAGTTYDSSVLGAPSGAEVSKRTKLVAGLGALAVAGLALGVGLMARSTRRA